MEMIHDKDDRKTLLKELNGKLKHPIDPTPDIQVDPKDVPPDWWKGDEEAQASSMAALSGLSRRKR